ncbi:hypothetical protein ACPEIC_17405 [Stenotrophomonas sp. NPDC087984]
MFNEAVPRQLQHLQHVPLGDRLLDAPRERGRGALGSRTGDNRLIGGTQGHPGLLQLVLDLRAEVSPARDAFDGLADDRSEAAIGPLRLVKEISHAAIAGNGDLELLVRKGIAPLAQLFTAGFHIVEMRDNHPAGRERGSRITQLPSSDRVGS